MNQWYKQLTKPSWSPPARLFGPVWTVLYVGIVFTFGAVVVMFVKSQISWLILLPFLLNIVFNVAFTPLQFKLRNNKLALLDIFLVLITLIWALLAIYPFATWISFVNIPYLLWVTFATVLQSSITWLNREL
ncbi:MAG: tryptophan-rich sensory protein [Clostridiaceae bacterium]|jgi:tryptophan-rich sensory protein|nr:tryptophan-rich sensory protein [Clostridiaceae bacterium]